MGYLDEAPVMDPNDATDLHPLDAFERLRAAANPTPSMPSMPSVPSAPSAPKADGDGWRGLLQMMAPLVGALAMKGGAKQTGFMNGYSEGQRAVEEDKLRKSQDAQKRATIAAGYVQTIADKADQIADPAQFAHFVSVADMTAAKAGFTKPGEIKSQLVFSPNRMAAQQLKELTDQLGSFEKGGYDLDSLAQSGAVLQLKDGTSVPIGTAMDITRARPLAGGKPLARPAKAAGTEEERAIVDWAKENGLDPKDLTFSQKNEARRQYREAGRNDTPKSLDERAASLLSDIDVATAKGDTATAKTKQAEYDRIIKAKKDLNGAGRNPQMDEINLSLKQLQLENERNKAKAANGGSYVVQPGSRDERIAQQLSTGGLTFSDFNRLLGARSAATIDRKLALYDKAMEMNPDFTPAAFEMGYKFASNPKTQNQMASINNVLSGVPDLLKFSDAAKRSGVTTLNKFILPGGFAVGGRTYSDFRTARVAFADELSGALGYGSATDMAREMGLDMTDPNLGPENFRSAMENVVVPFVERKGKSLTDPMGPYGKDKMPAKTPTAPAATTPPKKVGRFEIVGVK